MILQGIGDDLARMTSVFARARAEGKRMGRPSKTNSEQKQAIRLALSIASVSQVARDYKISRASVIAIREMT